MREMARKLSETVEDEDEDDSDDGDGDKGKGDGEDAGGRCWADKLACDRSGEG